MLARALRFINSHPLCKIFVSISDSASGVPCQKAQIVMDEHQKSKAPADGEARVKGMHLTDASSLHEASRNEGLKVETNGAHMSPGTTCTSPSDSSPIKSEKLSPSPQMMKDGHPDVVGGEMTVKMEPAHPPKLARTASQKASARPPALFDSYPDKTEESKGTFQVIGACIYSSKQIGSTEQAMECDCAEEWGKTTMAAADAIRIPIY